MNITVLGLGIIGGAWAKNLIADGHNVRTWNRTPKDFPNFHPSIQDAVDQAEAIIVVVADPPAVQSVLDQIAPKLGPGKLVIQSSTISAKWTLQFAEQVRKTGAEFLEAPFTGSKLAAEQRKTVYYLGGDAALVEKARPILRTLAGAIMHIGPLGSASSLKLAMNLNIAGIGQTLCESLALCRGAGISDEIYFHALSVNVARSGVSELKEPKLRNHDYSPQFSLKHMGKDLRLALETAAESSLPLEQTRSLKALYDRGMAAGWSDDDFIGLMRLLDQGA
ncbi:MAG TPA: NAD(P)-dependent oxidoreductase [Chthoniobacteraceae bacterium]|jgi:3-hydroxyisobutyrate dehydrogenase-like beta-hydroxyacid dehydrogenase|nr:NAD(P)-dependent oxidoreductase [Chthoniobacteraceae bacterium]